MHQTPKIYCICLFIVEKSKFGNSKMSASTLCSSFEVLSSPRAFSPSSCGSKNIWLEKRLRAAVLVFLFFFFICAFCQPTAFKTSTRPMVGSEVLYSLPVENSQQAEDETPVYRKAVMEGDKPVPLRNFPAPKYPSIWHILEEKKREHGNDVFLKYKLRNSEDKSFHTITYSEAYSKAVCIGMGLKNDCLNILKEKGTPKSAYNKVGIWSDNRYEWAVTDLAACGYGFITVPIFSRSSEANNKFAVQNTKLAIIFADNAALQTILKNPDLNSIKVVICYDVPSPADYEKAQERGIVLLRFDELANAYDDNQFIPGIPIEGDSVCTIVFSSGTTGNPKGCMLTSNNIVSFVQAYDEEHPLEDRKSSCLVSYLPLAHIAERSAEYAALYLGSKIAYYSGDVKVLFDDFAENKPDFLLVVPRVIDKLLKNVDLKIDQLPFLIKSVVNFLLKRKMQNIKNTGIYKSFFFDWVFNAVRKSVGNNVKLIISGSAPPTTGSLEKISALLSAPVCQMWGMTETLPATMKDIRDKNLYSVGGPTNAIEIKLKSVPEKNYSVNDFPHPRGDLYIRGTTVMKGYYDNSLENDDEQSTSTAFPSDSSIKSEVPEVKGFTTDGWFRTGDIAEVLENGSFKILDRSTSLYKSPTGEYVEPGKLESVYSSVKGVDQISVFQDPETYETYAVVVLEKENLQSKAKSKAATTDDVLRENYADQLKEIEACFDALAKSKQLTSVDKLKKIYYTCDPFTVENGLLSSSLKTVRNKISEFYLEELKKLPPRF